jgi:tetratricopeptide (TPR) repeat protein
MSRKRASFFGRHPEERGLTLYPKCNVIDNRTSPLHQRFDSEREDRKTEGESVQAPAPSGLPPDHTPWLLQKTRLEQQPGQEPEQVTTLVELVESQLVAGEAQQAVALLERAIARNSQDLRLLLLLGRAREALEDDCGAVDAYLTAVERGAWDHTVEAALLRDDFLLKTYPRSADLLLRLAARRESEPLWRRLARLCETQGDYEKASSLLTEAIRVKPDDVASLSILARIAERQQQFEEAAKWHRRILEIHPDLRASLLFLAQRHYAQSEYREALPYFERLLFQERGNRSGELYWLLSSVKGYGVQGLEERIGEVLRRQDLKTEERPLVQELLVVAGEDSLRREDLERAEQYLAQAYQMVPSTEAGRLLAEVASKKGERAQREGHLLHACVNYQRAAEYAPGNPTYTQQIAQAVALRAAERERRHWQKYKRIGLGAALILLLVGGILGMRHARERQRAPSAEDNGPTTASQEQTIAVQEKTAASPVREKADGSKMLTVSEAGNSGTREEKLQESLEGQQRDDQETKESPEVIDQSRVETAMALGMQVSGIGRGDPTRSLAAIRERVDKHLANLQAIYDRERANNPTLLGSLVLSLTIEPNGRVSQARLQSAKLSNTRIQERVLTLARTWQFSPAAGRVYVSYPLLFLPPGVDTASVIAWERGTAAVRNNASIPTHELSAGTE